MFLNTKLKISCPRWLARDLEKEGDFLCPCPSSQEEVGITQGQLLLLQEAPKGTLLIMNQTLISYSQRSRKTQKTLCKINEA